MNLNRKHVSFAAGALLVTSAMGLAYAQSAPALAAALAEGSVGEQADGYMGVRSAVSSAVRDEVDAINIKRRAATRSSPPQRGVTVKDVAATVGCETLASRVAQGRAYLLPDGQWRVKGAAPIPLPAYCVAN